MINLLSNGRTGTTTFGTIDNLSMVYAGNQLVKADDAGTNVTLSASMDFKNNSNTVKEYCYDLNGNLTQNLNKGITGITYNLLNSPRSITINNALGQGINTYTYATDGRKLQLVIGDKRTDYVGNMIYENGSLKRILIDGGHIEGGAYYFYFTDHFGNNRVVANANGRDCSDKPLLSIRDVFCGGVSTSKQPYKYNGKELDMEKELNLYDYLARLMNPVLGRFGTIDPKAEKYYGISPYAYCAVNPVNAIDPDGRLVIFINGMHFGDFKNREDMSAYWGGFDKKVVNHIKD
ncbi:RHS repeat-associated core domain-containing protein [uncultured Bacteroides sp.]|uniref:RHS repeat domain-containing protein n=1 Tax=uncultured Bacteroides sp. TaxID=162156 RepID=UPI002AAB4B2D|nr:RHS repeat-associated core domain-containing protein [uncultured Bacteroides sp.]